MTGLPRAGWPALAGLIFVVVLLVLKASLGRKMTNMITEPFLPGNLGDVTNLGHGREQEDIS